MIPPSYQAFYVEGETQAWLQAKVLVVHFRGANAQSSKVFEPSKREPDLYSIYETDTPGNTFGFHHGHPGKAGKYTRHTHR